MTVSVEHKAVVRGFGPSASIVTLSTTATTTALAKPRIVRNNLLTRTAFFLAVRLVLNQPAES